MNENERLENFINTEINNINEGINNEIIRNQCWRFCLSEYASKLDINRIIDISMQVYAEIVLRIEQQRQIEQQILKQ